MKIKLSVLLLSSMIFACLCTVLIDHLVISFWADSIAIPRATRMIYETPEFHYTVDTNSLGFRDREFSIEADPSVIRIAVLGDSFTYGWGVDEKESWPRILEDMLNQKGYPVVVLNLAKPGYFPFMYASYAKHYLPLIKPDIVLIGLLQGDDLFQMDYGDCGELKQDVAPDTGQTPETVRLDNTSQNFRKNPIIAYLKSSISMLYPNIMRMRSYKSRTQSEHLSTIWKRMAKDALRKFTPEQANRFTQLDKKIRTMFLRGELNPTLVQMAMINPEFLKELSSLDSARTNGLINRMSECLLVIKESGLRCGVRSTVAVSIPYGIYTCAKSYQNRLLLGLKLLPTMLSNNNADTAINLACKKADIPFISITEDFRRIAEKHNLFYQYDGHFNAQGHEAYAKLIAPAVMDILVQDAL